MIASPYFWLAVIALFLTVSGLSYEAGYKHATNAAKAATLETVSKSIEEAENQEQLDHKTAEQYEEKREVIRTVYVTVKEKARANIDQNPTYDQCGLDAAGLQLYNSRPGSAKSPAGILDGEMPRFASSSEWETINHSRE